MLLAISYQYEILVILYSTLLMQHTPPIHMAQRHIIDMNGFMHRLPLFQIYSSVSDILTSTNRTARSLWGHYHCWRITGWTYTGDSLYHPLVIHNTLSGLLTAHESTGSRQICPHPLEQHIWPPEQSLSLLQRFTQVPTASEGSGHTTIW